MLIPPCKLLLVLFSRWDICSDVFLEPSSTHFSCGSALAVVSPASSIDHLTRTCCSPAHVLEHYHAAAIVRLRPSWRSVSFSCRRYWTTPQTSLRDEVPVEREFSRSAPPASKAASNDGRPRSGSRESSSSPGPGSSPCRPLEKRESWSAKRTFKCLQTSFLPGDTVRNHSFKRTEFQGQSRRHNLLRLTEHFHVDRHGFVRGGRQQSEEVAGGFAGFGVEG